MARYVYRLSGGQAEVVQRANDIDAIAAALADGYAEVWRFKPGGERVLVFKRGEMYAS